MMLLMVWSLTMQLMATKQQQLKNQQKMLMLILLEMMLLMMKVMEEYGLALKEVTIDRMSEGIFYATLHTTDGFNPKDIDSRTTDAVTLALLCDAPLYVADSVLDECGTAVTPAQKVPETPTIESLERELLRCEENEEYERTAEIQQQIERLRHE